MEFKHSESRTAGYYSAIDSKGDSELGGGLASGRDGPGKWKEVR